MFYKMTPEFMGELKSLLGGIFTDDDFDRGVEAFENLINIANDTSNFDQDYGEDLNCTNLLDPKWDIYSGCRLEGFLRKIEFLKGTNTDGVMLQGFYTRLGFYNWLDEGSIQDARALDPINQANAMNVRGGEGFHLSEADASKYVDCPHYFSHYIVAYQLRNKAKGHDNPMEDNFIARIEKIKSLFVVYVHQCIVNYSIINEGYERQLIGEKIDYVTFAKSQMKVLEFFDKDFMQLDWSDEDNQPFLYEFQSSVKFVGEAGMGKTTQMKKMFLQLLQQVSEGHKKILPVWVDLSELSELEDVLLEEKVKQSLGEYKQYYSLLLKNNTIALFLDGYNEVLTRDPQDNVKRILARDIEEIHKNFPEVLIAMTDRSKKTIPLCLQKNITVYTFHGLSREKMADYVKLKADPASVDNIITYLNSENSRWLGNTAIIPAKMNSLIDLMSEGITPKDEDDFYDKYLDFILEREEFEKKETRITDLKYLLYILAQEMDHPADEKNLNEIIKLWLTGGLTGDLAEARRLFKLAVELPILVPGSSDNVYKFAYPQYFHKLEAGF